MSEQHLCDLAHIEDGGSVGHTVPCHDRLVPVMVIRRGDRVYAYGNACPHIGTPLDFTPGQFLDIHRRYILCSTHGALFRVEDGHCVSGPCAGASLTPVKATVRDGAVYVDLGTS